MSGRPFGTFWNTWRAASIFIRRDIDTASKIKFWKYGAVCLDEEALKKLLRLAYEKCLEWTEFICVTEEIKKHEKIDDFGFEATYDAALKGRPFGTFWNTWRAASIFIRRDIDTASKIKFWKYGAVCLDEEALKKLLRLAYEKCLEWTEFICVTEEIKKHEKIDDFGFEATYDAALKGLKKELEEEEKAKRAIREGPTAFAAPPCAALLEKDGPQRGVATRVAGNFKQLRDILDEWRAYSIWVIVWPMDLKFSESNICDVVKVCDRHFEGGGRIVTAWPPVVEKSIGAWKKMSEIWQMLDEVEENVRNLANA
ncbi:unnamed protein product [Heligmosomoides polygyrus]|uniref:Uncharacterized protein n=1 Tax=Heligmosomoides polygyrus TaxID=6339 RepID=A0A3P8CPE8_HELPZ|nr:unnamed protein product [Heligmosomoides polygyrus]